MLALASLVAGGCANIPDETVLAAFGSDAELGQYLRQVIPQPPERGAQAQALVPASSPANPIEQTGEDDVVQLHGDTLVILGGGRLSTVSIKQGRTQPIESTAAFPPGINASGDRHEEMSIAGDLVVVIGYGDARGGTKVSRFRIDDQGLLYFRDFYQLNLGSIDSSWWPAEGELILYSHLDLPGAAEDPLDAVPSLRRWDRNGRVGELQRVADSRRIYVPRFLRQAKKPPLNALQTVTACDLVALILECRATGILGPEGRSFYVTMDAVIVWVEDRLHEESGRCESASLVYRLPLDAGFPTATRLGNPLCPR
jgi:hypothetical protein